MQKFIAEPSFWEILPEASIGIMVVRAMKTADEVSSEDKAAIASILNEANATANQHLTSNTISENEVVAVWRRAYQLFKTKKGARCSIENLLKRGGKSFLPIGEEENAPTLPGELCYYDEEGAVCRCFNWRDGQRTELTDDSRNAILVIECVDGARLAELHAALDEFADLMRRFLSAEVAAKGIVTKDNPEMTIVE